MSRVAFPTAAIVSLLYLMADGALAETAVVGIEGVVGVPLSMGSESTPRRGTPSMDHGLCVRCRTDQSVLILPDRRLRPERFSTSEQRLLSPRADHHNGH